MQEKKVSERRMGPPGSENWNAMLDGAEAILRDEGHASLTSRRVAEHIGVKQRLVYYYFRTMDDLVVETFRRLSERELARLEAARSAELPLHEIWDVCVHTTDARLVTEFMALAARIEGLGKEVIHFIEASRKMQVDTIRDAMKRSGAKLGLPAEALAILATSTALALSREADLGVRFGHEETRALLENVLRQLEPA
jgi:AcrR family transcriptional regulator